MKRKIAFVTALIVLVLSSTVFVGGTLAWLFERTGEVVNTFTPSDIKVELSETTGNEYQMVPGTTIGKDPKVTVTNDIDAYVFVKIVESGSVTVTENNIETTYTFDDFLTYAIESGWKLYNSGAENIDTVNNNTYVIYREVGKNDTTKTFSVLSKDQVTVNTTVTKQMMDALKTAGETQYPKLTFTAAAVQKDNLDLEQAYAQAFPTT